MPTDIDSKLRELLDREAIRDCLYRYCRAIDRHDEALLRTVYWPEAQDRHGAVEGTVEEFIAHVMPLTKMLENIVHNLGNILIELNGDSAKVESYFSGYHRVRNADNVLVDSFYGGRYLDRMQKRAGEWRTADRMVVYDWFLKEEPAAHDYTREIQGFVPRTGGKKPHDPLYAWLGVSR
jgi:hypothetical protein